MAATLDHRKIRGGESKWLLKKAMEPKLSRDVHRPKMGLAPLARWFRGPLRAGLSRPCSVVYWQKAACSIDRPQRLVDQHLSGVRDFSSPLWSVLMFESFLRRVIRVQPENVAERRLAS
jgi:asparagine synthase (glutamine-hydrolysing)